jgi:hypothetical protein
VLFCAGHDRAAVAAADFVGAVGPDVVTADVVTADVVAADVVAADVVSAAGPDAVTITDVVTLFSTTCDVSAIFFRYWSWKIREEGDERRL